MHFQDLILSLERYWAAYGCVIAQPYDGEVGAGTMHPATFLRALGPEPWKVAYTQPSRRPTDGRYGKNPNRLYTHLQYQVLLKPAPADVQDLYLRSIAGLGIKMPDHDLRFLEDDWEAPTLGAWGLGWQVFLDGQEISQFTYMQQVGGMDVPLISAELTYGLERIAQSVQRKDSVFDLVWAPGVTYGEIRQQEEFEQSMYALETADVAALGQLFEAYEREARRLLDARLAFPAYEYTLKCSHVFNLLDARGAVGVAERAALMGRCRALARRSADLYLARREEMGWPLLRDRVHAA
ncbi:MAG: glycine--tRNA ligase subunit alpha [Bacillati bacterium ANGP1]|uniref:Glycine--tRNA ligase alpha subunit n=1 Tax=Candidatus Segetimicrobium genomatis TaxID=2569760 RepID=A0A537K5U5_9BACT|nr:MAG: glycine--tRNA ligase subunit alpha [Terrabacteria group bacterium ANGP1]